MLFTIHWTGLQRRRTRPRIGIVVFSDNAKYDMESSGEYTQGAGGGGILIRANPRLLVIPDTWGVSTTPVHDFFKPRREVPVKSVIERVLDLARETGQSFKSGLSDRMMRNLRGSKMSNDELFAEDTLKIHRDTPVFDGQFSNRCYMESVKQAFIDFHGKARRNGRLDQRMILFLQNNGKESLYIFLTHSKERGCFLMCLDMIVEELLFGMK